MAGLWRILFASVCAVSLASALVWIEAERIRLKHEELLWERICQELEAKEEEAEFRYEEAWQKWIPGKPLLQYLREERARNES